MSQQTAADSPSVGASVPLADEMLVTMREELVRREEALSGVEASLVPLRREVARLRHAVAVLEGRTPPLPDESAAEQAGERSPRPRVRWGRSVRIAAIRELLDSGERITGMVVAERLEVSPGYAQELLAVARREAAAEAAARGE